MVALFRRLRAHACSGCGAVGTLVGLAHFLFHRSTISIESICYLQDLFTIEAARGNGVLTNSGLCLLPPERAEANTRAMATLMKDDAT